MKLLEPFKMGNLTIKNRVMFPPLTTGYEERDGSIGEQSLNFYKRLAEGGVSYIVIGDVTPIMTMSPTPKLYSDNQIPTFKKLADTLHEFDCKLGIQVFHPEYHAEKIMELLMSGKKDEGLQMLHYDMIHFVNEVSKEELLEIIDKIGACVKRASEAGIDVIEIHGDRLCGSLCSTILNHRTDSFGGDFENRIRFAINLVDKVKETVPSMTIEYKLPIVTVNPDGSLRGKGGLQIEEAIKFAKILETHGVDAIHIAQANHTGNMNDTIPAMGTRQYAYMIEDTKKIKNAVSIPISFAGRITGVSMAESLLNQGIVDYIPFGRNLLTDPDIVKKAEKNQCSLIRQCMMCNKGCTDSITSRKFLSCVLNAENGYEYKRVIKQAEIKKRIAVVGAGIAGLEATRVLALKGHNVTLFEKDYEIGGQINIAKLPPRKEEMERCLIYYKNVFKTLPNIKLELGKEFVKADGENFDEVIIATGAKSLRPNIPGINNENVIDSFDLLAGKKNAYGKIAVCGGGLVGSEIAEYLATRGYNVSIIEMKDKIASEESPTILPEMLNDFTKYGVSLYPLHQIKEFTLNGVKTIVLDKDGNAIEEKMIEADTIINALSTTKVLPDLEGMTKNIHYIGDCSGEGPSNIEHAIKSAYDVANSI